MSIISDASALNGQKKLLEAEMTKFEGLRMIGRMQDAEGCREVAHALLDAWFDGQAGFAEDIRRGRYM